MSFIVITLHPDTGIELGVNTITYVVNGSIEDLPADIQALITVLPDEQKIIQEDENPYIEDVDVDIFVSIEDSEVPYEQGGTGGAGGGTVGAWWSFETPTPDDKDTVPEIDLYIYDSADPDSYILYPVTGLSFASSNIVGNSRCFLSATIAGTVGEYDNQDGSEIWKITDTQYVMSMAASGDGVVFYSTFYPSQNSKVYRAFSGEKLLLAEYVYLQGQPYVYYSKENLLFYVYTNHGTIANDIFLYSKAGVIDSRTRNTQANLFQHSGIATCDGDLIKGFYPAALKTDLKITAPDWSYEKAASRQYISGFLKTSDDRVFLAGADHMNSVDPFIFITCFNKSGTVLYDLTFGEDDKDETFHSLAVTKNGWCLLVSTVLYTTPTVYRHRKLDPDGAVIWSMDTPYSGPEEMDESGNLYG